MNSHLVFCLLSFLNFSSCSRLFYHPGRTLFPPPPHIKHIPPFKDFFFEAQDGVRLHGRHFFAKKPLKGTLLQFHGNAENLTTHSWGLTWITQHGYNLLTFDYRGYGLSQSSPTPEGIRLDALAFLQKARQIHQGPGKTLIIVGQSLGGAVALKAIEDLQIDLIDLLVLDSAFSSYREIVFEKLTAHWFTWPLGPLAYLFVSDKTSAHLERFKTPLLVIHSENDPVVPFQCAISLYQQAASSKKTFWKGKEVGHTLAFESLERRKRFLQFLEGI